jgi:protein-disulfide isomerase
VSQPRARQASPRVLAIAGVVVLIVIAGIVAAVLLSGGKKKSDTSTLPLQGSLTNALPGAADVHSMLAGIRQSGLYLGSASAPVRLVEYIDLQCPFCQQFETQVMPDIIAKYVRTGKVEIEARTLAFIGSDSLRGRNAMFAASLQNHAFDFAQLLYDNQGTENTGWLNDAIVAKAAESIPGLNPRLLVEASTSDAMVSLGNRVNQLAKVDKVNGTPTLLVGKVGTQPKLVKMASPTDAAAVTTAIDAALR